jgi:hypothetical protein
MVMVVLEVVEGMRGNVSPTPYPSYKDLEIHPLLVLLKDNQVEVEIIIGLLLVVEEVVELQMQVQWQHLQQGGNGGDGATTSINGTPTTRAGGGGGGGQQCWNRWWKWRTRWQEVQVELLQSQQVMDKQEQLTLAVVEVDLWIIVQDQVLVVQV